VAFRGVQTLGLFFSLFTRAAFSSVPLRQLPGSCHEDCIFTKSVPLSGHMKRGFSNEGGEQHISGEGRRYSRRSDFTRGCRWRGCLCLECRGSRVFSTTCVPSRIRHVNVNLYICRIRPTVKHGRNELDTKGWDKTPAGTGPKGDGLEGKPWDCLHPGDVSNEQELWVLSMAWDGIICHNGDDHSRREQ
jgi:hypothetical protein